MVDYKIPSHQAGVTRWAIAPFGPYVAYASTEGLVLVNGTSASVEQSNQIFGTTEWQRMWWGMFDNMRIAVHDNTLIVYSDDGNGTSKSILLRYDNGTVNVVRYEPDSGYVQASFHNTVNDNHLYLVEGSIIKRFWASPTERTAFTYRSKHFDLPTPATFSVVMVEGYGQATISVYSGVDSSDNEWIDTPFHTETVT